MHEYAPAFAECLEAHLDSVSWTARGGVSTAKIIGFSNKAPNKAAINMTVLYTAEAMGYKLPELSCRKYKSVIGF